MVLRAPAALPSRSSVRPRRLLAAGLGAVAVASALTACGGGDDAAGPGDSGSASDSAAPSNTATTSPKSLKTPPVPKNAKGALSDISFDASSCGLDAGKQTVKGTVTNSTSARAVYVITISWISPTNDTLGNGFTVVRNLAPGKKVDWTVNGTVAQGAASCVPQVFRGTPR